MYRILYFILYALLFVSCTNEIDKKNGHTEVQNIIIFETYLKDTATLNDFSAFLRDTLQLPVEWEPFDLFGDGVVYDIAFFLGNTTFELVALYASDSTMQEKARFNRVIFGTENIEELSTSLTQADVQHEPPADFNIYSGGTRFAMGKQTTLDSLSKASNVFVSFWQYFPDGLNFAERPIKAETVAELYGKLNLSLDPNPMGIIDLKEVQLSLTDEVINEWDKILGYSEKKSWKLSDGPTIFYTQSSLNKGVDGITIRVKDLEKAKDFLSTKNLLSISNDRVFIDQTRVYGLKIFIEE